MRRQFLKMLALLGGGGGLMAQIKSDDPSCRSRISINGKCIEPGHMPKEPAVEQYITAGTSIFKEPEAKPIGRCKFHGEVKWGTGVVYRVENMPKGKEQIEGLYCPICFAEMLNAYCGKLE